MKSNEELAAILCSELPTLVDMTTLAEFLHITPSGAVRRIKRSGLRYIHSGGSRGSGKVLVPRRAIVRMLAADMRAEK